MRISRLHEEKGAIILGVNNPAGVEYLRSFSESSIPTVALDVNANALGFFSRHCQESEVIPEDVLHLVKTLQKIGEKKQGWLLIPNTDHYTIIISKVFDILSTYFMITTSPWTRIKNCVDKLLTYKLSQRSGVPIPKIFYPKNVNDVNKISEKINYRNRWILKPRSRDLLEFKSKIFLGVKALSVESKADLKNKSLQYYRETGRFPLIQEEIPGDAKSLCQVMVVIDRMLQPVAIHIGSKIRQSPYDYGMSTYYRSAFIEEVRDYGLKVAHALRCRGILAIEFKRDPRDGIYKIIEVNPRAPIFFSIARLSGLDMPRILYDVFLKNVNVNRLRYDMEIRWWSLRRDLILLLNERRRYSLTKEIFRLLKASGKIRASDYFCISDPLPFIADLFKYLQSRIV